MWILILNAIMTLRTIADSDEYGNGCYYSYQRFWHVNEAYGSFSIVLTNKPRLNAARDKRSCTCNKWCNKTVITAICKHYCQNWLICKQYEAWWLHHFSVHFMLFSWTAFFHQGPWATVGNWCTAPSNMASLLALCTGKWKSMIHQSSWLSRMTRTKWVC